SENNPVFAIEVKIKRGTNAEWAAYAHQTMLTYGQISDAQYFLLALPDRFYLWTDQPQNNLEPPTYVIDPLAFLAPYFEKAGVTPENITEMGFRLLILLWLNELIRVDEPSKMAERWLIDSGLLDTLRQGHITLT